MTQGPRVSPAECAHDELGLAGPRGPERADLQRRRTTALRQQLQVLRQNGSYASALPAPPHWQFDTTGERKLLSTWAQPACRPGAQPPATPTPPPPPCCNTPNTQGRQLTHVHSVQVQRDDDLIDLPASTRRNLELVKTLRGEDSPPCSRCSIPA